MQKEIVFGALGFGITLTQCFMIKEFHVEIKELKQNYQDSLMKGDKYRRDLRASETKVKLYKNFIENKGLGEEFSKLEKERQVLEDFFYW